MFFLIKRTQATWQVDSVKICKGFHGESIYLTNIITINAEWFTWRRSLINNYKLRSNLPMKTKFGNTIYFAKMTLCVPIQFALFASVCDFTCCVTKYCIQLSRALLSVLRWGIIQATSSEFQTPFSYCSNIKAALFSKWYENWGLKKPCRISTENIACNDR